MKCTLDLGKALDFDGDVYRLSLGTCRSESFAMCLPDARTLAGSGL
jgi:hypothetical protein